MGLLSMALRNIRTRLISSCLTATGVALGIGLVVAVWTLEREARDAFRRTAVGVEVLVGGNKGGRIELMLSTLYHVGRAPGRVAWDAYEKIAADPRVRFAVPVAVGDRYRGLPVVGTTGRFFDEFGAFGVEGFGEEPRAAIIGSEAAGRSGLGVGDRFHPSHSGHPDDPTHRHEEFVVTEVARATGTAHDRAIWVRIEDFLALSGHDGLARDGAEQRAVSAVLVKTTSGSPLVVEPLIKEINDGTEAQAIRPLQVVGELFVLVGNAQRVLAAVAWLVVVVASLSVAVTLYHAMASRRRQIAILRSLGATRARVFGVVLFEAVLICVAGALAGLLLAHTGAVVAAPLLESRAGIVIERAWMPHASEVVLVVLVALAGACAGLIPAWTAYRSDIAAQL